MAGSFGSGGLGGGSASDGSASLDTFLDFEAKAHEVAARLPDLTIEAQRIAATVAHGIHGRRRAGPGETFWQFRQYQNTDSTSLIDWRRTASSTHVYVREREWEAAHTIWLWPDLSPSMNFSSHLSSVTKRERAIILMLAASELLVRGGERVAMIGLSNPTASRRAMVRMAETIAGHARDHILVEGLPPKTHLPRFSSALLFSDFLDPLDDIAERVHMLAADGVSGHLVQILDPAEETLPYEGRAEFVGAEGGERWIADRAESVRDGYQARLRAHRDGLIDLAHRLGWSFLVHHTDRPASEPLLTLIMRLQGTGGDGWRWQGNVDAATSEGQVR